MNKIYIIALAVILLVGIILYFTVKRNYFNKYKYIRLVRYNEDKTIDVNYIKKEQFKETYKGLKIDSNHIYNFKGYQTIITTSNSPQSINPLNFESKYEAKKFEDAMKSKFITDTFNALTGGKFDKLMALLFLNIIQLLAIVYLLYTLLGAKS